MLLDFAPLEGITTTLFRRLHREYFPGVDRYYTPFLSPTADRRFTPKEQREFFPEHNRGLSVIPQILTKNADDFLWAAEELHSMGYDEVNLNLGCPSGTVTAKGKGAGMLADPQALDTFLDRIYSKAPCKISVKTRLGMETPDEFYEILEIYKRYPLSELIVHPRVRKDFYRYPVRRESFGTAYDRVSCPVSYNGSIITPKDYAVCISDYPNLYAVMIGQGLVSDPFLAAKIKFGVAADVLLLKEFHDRLFDGYAAQFQSQNNAAKRMKELWFYLSCCFEDSTPLLKKLQKSRTAEEYLDAAHQIFRTRPLLPYSTGNW